MNGRFSIVPPGDLEAWDGLVLCQATDHRDVRSHCRWLALQYAEVLRTYFDHRTEPQLGRSYLPELLAALLDRRLYAPKPLRPVAIVEDTQSVEADLRIEDPFNHRAF